MSRHWKEQLCHSTAIFIGSQSRQTNCIKDLDAWRTRRSRAALYPQCHRTIYPAESYAFLFHILLWTHALEIWLFWILGNCGIETQAGLFLGFGLVSHSRKKVAYGASAGLRDSHLHMFFRSAPLSPAHGDVTDGRQGRLAEPQHLVKCFHIRKES